jgi:hypothetical protein
MGKIESIEKKIIQLEAKIPEAEEPLRLAQLEMARHLNEWHTGKVNTKETVTSAEMVGCPII